MKYKFGLIAACALLFGACSENENTPIVIEGGPAVEPQVGDVYPLWHEGTLEVHSISTGRGECNLYILPDGTTLLVDAAGSLVTEEYCASKGIGTVTPPRPSASVSGSEVIANYIRHFNPRGNNVDYYLNSHSHEDHMGSWVEKYDYTQGWEKHPQGNFYVNGLAKLGTDLTFAKIIDRGLTLPINQCLEDRIRDYQRFLKWTMDTKGTVYEAAKVGSNTQIGLKYNPSKYPEFEIRILCASGYAWTGDGENTTRTIPLIKSQITAQNPDENIFSVAFMLNYGKFNLFTAGDLQWEANNNAPWLNADQGILPVVSEVEVMKASHHGSTNANSVELVDKLNPQVVWVNPWRSEQPGYPCVKRFVDRNPDVDIFTTNIVESSKAPLSSVSDNFKSWNGHIVIRVQHDGSYMVYVLDDNDESYRVKSIHGPYRSR